MNRFFKYDNTDPSYIPVNTLNECKDDNTDDIFVNGTTNHVFIIPYMVETLEEIEITYYNELKNKFVFTSDSENIKILANDNTTIISCELTPEQTSQFKAKWDTWAQVRVTFINNDVVFTRKYKIIVIDTL